MSFLLRLSRLAVLIINPRPLSSIKKKKIWIKMAWLIIFSPVNNLLTVKVFSKPTEILKILKLPL